MDKIITDKLILKKFGLLMTAVFFLIELVMFVRTKQVFILPVAMAMLFVLLAALLPSSLKYIYILWMRLAYFLSWVNTRLLLGIMFYFIFSPIGLFMRLFKIDPLKKKCVNSVDSYWQARIGKKIPPTDYHRQS